MDASRLHNYCRAAFGYNLGLDFTHTVEAIMDYDTDKVDEAVLALLILTVHQEDDFGARTWKRARLESAQSPL